MSQEPCQHDRSFSANCDVRSSPENLECSFVVRCDDCGTLMQVDTTVPPRVDVPKMTAVLRFVRPNLTVFKKETDGQRS